MEVKKWRNSNEGGIIKMESIVRPLLTVVEKDGKFFVSAEIPGVDLADRPVFYKGKSRRVQNSCIPVYRKIV